VTAGAGGAGEAGPTRCEWCGAEYAAGEAPPPRPPSGPPPPPPAPAEGEPLTHCEWCGAEYPQPGEGGDPHG
jgi:hypothetical protein